MNVCQYCGLNQRNNVHAPGCEFYLKSTEERREPDKFTAALYDTILARSHKFMYTYLTDIVKRNNDDMPDEVADEYVSEALTNPLVRGAVIAGSMLTIEVLQEQGLVDEAQANDLSRQYKENWMDD